MQRPGSTAFVRCNTLIGVLRLLMKISRIFDITLKLSFFQRYTVKGELHLTLSCR